MFSVWAPFLPSLLPPIFFWRRFLLVLLLASWLWRRCVRKAGPAEHRATTWHASWVSLAFFLRWRSALPRVRPLSALWALPQGKRRLDDGRAFAVLPALLSVWLSWGLKGCVPRRLECFLVCAPGGGHCLLLSYLCSLIGAIFAGSVRPPRSCRCSSISCGPPAIAPPSLSLWVRWLFAWAGHL